MAPNTDSDDYKSAVNDDISSLKKEIARLQKLVAGHSAEAYYEMRDKAGKIYDEAAPRAKNAVDHIRSESAAAAQVAREHPAAASTAMLLAGAIGFIAGYIVAKPQRSRSQYWWR
ncbi:hypothetical protein [Oryzifoliimicrobium ureilyticus]|uniref:hypothetical protein n=1 Tax=Oryzifoliimicrobium ureilyticus TaxID=3113724 RepID=UPI0030767433